MSCAWDYYCPQCDDACGAALNHGAARLRQFASAAPVLAPVMQQAGYGDAFELHTMYAGLPVESALGWLQRHAGHPVCLQDEYGSLEPLDPAEPQRQFHVLFTVTEAERRHLQATWGLAALPDSADLQRGLAARLRTALTTLIANMTPGRP